MLFRDVSYIHASDLVFDMFKFRYRKFAKDVFRSANMWIFFYLHLQSSMYVELYKNVTHIVTVKCNILLSYF